MIEALTKTDEALLQGLLSSDSSQINQIYDLVLPAVIQWVKANNGTEADARDIFQEALIALYKKLQQGPVTLVCTLKSFLRIMCRNLWLTKIRDGQKWQMSEPEILDMVAVEEAVTKTLEQSAQDRIYYRQLDKLGEKCRQILLWFFESVSLSEIATRLETSENYIKKRKFQCKEQLVAAIKADPEFESL